MKKEVRVKGLDAEVDDAIDALNRMERKESADSINFRDSAFDPMQKTRKAKKDEENDSLLQFDDHPKTA